MRQPRCAAAAILAAALACAASGPAPRAQEPPKDPPRRIGVVEEVGVGLTLMDVEVVDAEGRPIRGLRKGDFAVTLDGRTWPVYSVDDLCACAEAPTAGAAGPVPAKEDTAQPRSSTPEPTIPPDPMRYILYFDFSQLQPDGREAAIREASRWIRETLRPPDLAMIVAYASTPGLEEICPFTSDNEVALQGVEAISRDPAFVDPWPAFLEQRMCECSEYPAPLVCKARPDEGNPMRGLKERNVDINVCRFHASNEYLHGRRSLEAFQGFLETLQEVPGRKAVILFNQNGVLHPGYLYMQGDRPGENTSVLEEAAATATAARAAVYPAFVGDPLDENEILDSLAVSLGANLADFTGGRYNRGALDLGQFLDAVSRGSCCIYRVAIEPPRKLRRRAYRVRVEVAGRSVPWDYRVRFEDEISRWFRRARAVLRRPDEARALPVRAALVPVAASGSDWEIRAEVAVEADALSYLPSPTGRIAEWEVGALLHEEESGRDWEMLGFSSLARKGEAGRTGDILHARQLQRLRPGSYRLVAFVRDAAADLFGGAECNVTLPRRGSDGVAGPVLMLSARRHYAAELPLLPDKRGREARVREARVGALPAGALPVAAGARVEARTWICPGSDPGNTPTPIRYLSRDGTPLFRFEDARPDPAGDCLLFTDRIETEMLEPGEYAYSFRWTPASGDDPLEVRATFELEARSGLPARVASPGTM